MHVQETPLCGEHAMVASEKTEDVGTHHAMGPPEDTEGVHERTEILETIASDPSRVCEAICQKAHQTGVNYLREIQKKAALNQDRQEGIEGQERIRNNGYLEHTNKESSESDTPYGYFNRIGKEQRRLQYRNEIHYQKIDNSCNSLDSEKSTFRMRSSPPDHPVRGLPQPIEPGPEGHCQTTGPPGPFQETHYSRDPIGSYTETKVNTTKQNRRKRKRPQHIEEGVEYPNNNGNVNAPENVVNAFVNVMKQRKAAQEGAWKRYDQQRTIAVPHQMPSNSIPYAQVHSQYQKTTNDVQNEDDPKNKINSNSTRQESPHQARQPTQVQYHNGRHFHHHIKQSIQQQLENPQYYKEQQLYKQMHGLDRYGFVRNDQKPYPGNSLSHSEEAQYWKAGINATSNSELPPERTSDGAQMQYINDPNSTHRESIRRHYEKDQNRAPSISNSFPVESSDTNTYRNGEHYPYDKFQTSGRWMDTFDRQNGIYQYDIPIAEGQTATGKLNYNQPVRNSENKNYHYNRESNMNENDFETRNEKEPIPRHNVMYFPTAEDRLQREHMAAQPYPYFNPSNGHTAVANAHPRTVVNGHNPETSRPLNYKNGPPPLYEVIPSNIPRHWQIHEVNFPTQMHQQMNGHQKNRKRRTRSNNQPKVGKGVRKRGRPRKNGPEDNAKRDDNHPEETTKEQGFPKSTMLNYIPLDLSTNKKIQHGSDISNTDDTSINKITTKNEDGTNTENPNEMICIEVAQNENPDENVDIKAATYQTAPDKIPSKSSASSSPPKKAYSFQDAFLQFQQKDVFQEGQDVTQTSWHTPSKYVPNQPHDSGVISEEAKSNGTHGVQPLIHPLDERDGSEARDKEAHDTVVTNDNHTRSRKSPTAEIQIIDGQETIVCYIDEDYLLNHQNKELMAKLSHTDAPEVVKRLLAKPIETQQELLAATSKMVPYNSQPAKRPRYQNHKPYYSNYFRQPQLFPTSQYPFYSPATVPSIPYQDANNNTHLHEQMKYQNIMSQPRTHFPPKQVHTISPSHVPTDIPAKQNIPTSHSGSFKSSPHVPAGSMTSIICKICNARFDTIPCMEQHFIHFHKIGLTYDKVEMKFANQIPKRAKIGNVTNVVSNKDDTGGTSARQESSKSVTPDLVTKPQDSDTCINPPRDTTQDDESKIAAETLISLQSRSPSEERQDAELRLQIDEFNAANVLVDMKHNTPQVSPVKQVVTGEFPIDRDKRNSVDGCELSSLGSHHKKDYVDIKGPNVNAPSPTFTCDSLKNLARSSIRANKANTKPLIIDTDKGKNINEPSTSSAIKKAQRGTGKGKLDQEAKPSRSSNSSGKKNNCISLRTGKNIPGNQPKRKNRVSQNLSKNRVTKTPTPSVKSDQKSNRNDKIRSVTKGDSIILKPNKKYGQKSFFRISLKKQNNKSNPKKKPTVRKTSVHKESGKDYDKQITELSDNESVEKETIATLTNKTAEIDDTIVNQSDVLDNETNKNTDIKDAAEKIVDKNVNGVMDPLKVANDKVTRENINEDPNSIEKQCAEVDNIITESTPSNENENTHATTEKSSIEETAFEKKESEEIILDIEDELPDIPDDDDDHQRSCIAEKDTTTVDLMVKNMDDSQIKQYLVEKSVDDEAKTVEELYTFGNDFVADDGSLGIKVISTFSLATNDGVAPPELALNHGIATDMNEKASKEHNTVCEQQKDSNPEPNELDETSLPNQSIDPLNRVQDSEADADTKNATKMETANEDSTSETNEADDHQENDEETLKEVTETTKDIQQRNLDEITVEGNDATVINDDAIATGKTGNVTMPGEEAIHEAKLGEQETNDPSEKQDGQVSSSNVDQNLSSRLNVFDILSATKSDDTKVSSTRSLRVNSAPTECVEPDTSARPTNTTKDNNKIDCFFEKAKKFGQMLKSESPIKSKQISERSLSESYPRYEIISRDLSKRQPTSDPIRAVKLKRNARKSTRTSDWEYNFYPCTKDINNQTSNGHVKTALSDVKGTFQMINPKELEMRTDQPKEIPIVKPVAVKKEKVILKKNARKSGVSAAELNLAMWSLDTRRRPKQHNDPVISKTENPEREEITKTSLPGERKLPKMSTSSESVKTIKSVDVDKVDTPDKANDNQKSRKKVDEKRNEQAVDGNKDKTEEKQKIDIPDQLQQLIGIVTKRTDKLKKPIQQEEVPKNNSKISKEKRKLSNTNKEINEKENINRRKKLCEEKNNDDAIKQTSPSKQHTMNGFSNLKNIFAKNKETTERSEHVKEKINEIKIEPSVQQTVEGFNHLKNMFTKAAIEHVEPMCSSSEDEGNIFEIPIEEPPPRKEDKPHSENDSHKGFGYSKGTTENNEGGTKITTNRKVNEDDDSSDDDKEKIKCQNLLMKLKNLRTIAQKSYEKQIEGKYSDSSDSDDESDDEVMEVLNGVNKTPNITEASDSDDELPDILKEMAPKSNKCRYGKHARDDVKNTTKTQTEKPNVSTKKRRKRCPSERHQDDQHSFDPRTKPCKVALRDISTDVKYKEATEFRTIKLSKCYGLPKYGLSDQDESDQQDQSVKWSKKRNSDIRQITRGMKLKNINIESSSECCTEESKNKGTSNGKRGIKRNTLSYSKEAIQDVKRTDRKQRNDGKARNSKQCDENKGDTGKSQYNDTDYKQKYVSDGGTDNEENNKNSEGSDTKQSNEDNNGTGLSQSNGNQGNKGTYIKHRNNKIKVTNNTKQYIKDTGGAYNKQNSVDMKWANAEIEKYGDTDVKNLKDDHPTKDIATEDDEHASENDDGDDSDTSESTIPFDIVSSFSSCFED